MEHNFIQVSNDLNVMSVELQQMDNNLDKLDNLDTLPSLPAVYTVCGKVNGNAANPRFVDATPNLQETIKKLFLKTSNVINENCDCIKEFMLSIKTKVLIYQLLENSSEADRTREKQIWEERYKPKCNSELNKIH